MWSPASGAPTAGRPGGGRLARPCRARAAGRDARRQVLRRGGADRRRPLGSPGRGTLGRYPSPVEIGNLEKVLRVGEGRRRTRRCGQAAYSSSLEPESAQLAAADLQGKTAEFRQRLENGETLDDLVFE